MQVSLKDNSSSKLKSVQSQQRRAIHEQAMASVTEQLEDPYHVQITGSSSSQPHTSSLPVSPRSE